MRREQENCLLLEEQLLGEFQKLLLILKNGGNLIMQRFQLQNIYLTILKEQSVLSLSLEGQDLIQSMDFYSLYYETDFFDPNVRLHFLLKVEQMKQWRKKSLKKNLTPFEKENYYKMLFHFRLVESFFLWHEKENYHAVSFQYMELYYHLLYSTPSLENLFDVNISLSYWTHGKNLSFQEYSGQEKKYLNEFLNDFFVHYETIPIEVLDTPTNLNYIASYFQLASSYYSKEELGKMIDAVILDAQKRTI